MTYLYKISRPKTVTDTMPVLVTLHGMGSNYHDLTSIAGSGEKTFVQIDVQGDKPFRSGYTYYIPEFSKQTEEEVISGTLSRLNQFMNDTYKKEKLSANQPLFFLGFSQGAILSLSYALTYPDNVAGAVVLNGRLPQYITDRKKTPVFQNPPAFFIAQGQFDPLFSLEVGRSINNYLTEKGFETGYHEYPVAHGVIAPEVQDIRKWLTDHFNA